MKQLISLIVIVTLILSTQLGAQEDASETPADLTKTSLPLRTALHHDPTLKAPLDQLLNLYRTAKKVDELVNTYRAHATQYPQDERGRIVLVRLLAATNSADARQIVQDAVKAFPQSAFLHFLHYESRLKSHDPRAIESLDKAIELEKLPAQRMVWTDLLLDRAVETGRRDLAVKNLQQLTKLSPQPDQRLEIARRMIRYKFFEEALKLLKEPTESKPSPETMVSIELEAAKAEVSLKKNDEAGKRLDALLDRLTADYWRRGEIVTRRLALLESAEDRKKMIDEARKRLEDRPKDEAAVLDLAHVLTGLQHRREALKVLTESAERLPASEAIERQTIELFDRLHDERGKLEYLAKRLEKSPERSDLAMMRIKSLFQLGKGDEAQKLWQSLIDDLPKSEQGDQYIEIARYLRQSQLLKDAADAFAEAIKRKPDRLDVRRELAEVHLAMGNRQRMRETLTIPLPEDAPSEIVLDLVQYMINQKLYLDAQSILEKQRSRDDENMDVRVLMIDLARRLGDLNQGIELIDETRALADTGAKYRRWLEAAIALHDEFETAGEFVTSETVQLRTEGDRWDESSVERRLALADVAGKGESSDEVIAMLEQDLAANPPEKIRVQIRQKLIKTYETDLTKTLALQQHLKSLAEDDPRYESEVNARLVLLHDRQKRHDLMTPLLPKIDVNQLNDPALLSALVRILYARHNDPAKVGKILRRLTQINPSDRANWQQWLTYLATRGDEDALRMAIRRLLAGVDKMELSEDVRTQLQQRLVGSFWRSISRRLESDENSISEVIVLLDQVEGMVASELEWSWAAWVRAYVLHQSHQVDVAEEAVAEWERVVEQMYASAGDIDDDQRSRIALPDGITISVEHARKLLRSPVDVKVGSVAPPTSRTAPLPPYRTRWSFDTDGSTEIASVVPAKDQCLVIDKNGTAYCVNSTNGRLIWSRPKVAKTVGTSQQQQYISNPWGHSSYQMVETGRPTCAEPVPFGDRFVVSDSDTVACYSLKDGSLLWKSFVGSTKSTKTRATKTIVSIFASKGHVVAYEPVSSTFVRIDPATGKVVWDRQLEKQSINANQNAWSCGAQLRGDRLLFFGTHAGILDLTTNKILWSFEPWRVSEFPVKLDAPAAASTGATPYAPTTTSGTVQAISYVDFQTPQPTFVPRPQMRVGLTTSAVVWAANGKNGSRREARLLGNQLILVSDQGVLIANTHLPLSTKRVSVSGQLVGVSGRKACFVYGTTFSIVDLIRNTNNSVSLNELVVPNSQPWFDVTLDGPMAFVSGPRGALCINSLTNQVIFKMILKTAADAKTLQGNQASQQQLQIAQPVYSGPTNNRRASTIGRVRDGAVYMLQTQSKLVALERKTPQTDTP